MAPTFRNNEITLLVKKTIINKNDVIVFKKDDTIYIKRVIAKFGDNVKLHDGHIYINGINQMPYTYDGDNMEYNLHENEYFVIGDNYNNSVDSRVYGLINSSNVIGKPIKQTL